MNEFVSNVVTVLYPILLATLTFLAGKLSLQIAPAIEKIVPIIIDYIVAKVGSVRFDNMVKYSKEIWGKLDEDGRLGDFVGDKIEEYDKMMLAKFPKITAVQLNLFNKGLAGVINKGKEVVVKDVEAEVIKGTPIVKYFNPNTGKELVDVTLVSTSPTDTVKTDKTTENVPTTPTP